MCENYRDKYVKVLEECVVRLTKENENLKQENEEMRKNPIDNNSPCNGCFWKNKSLVD